VGLGDDPCTNSRSPDSATLVVVTASLLEAVATFSCARARTSFIFSKRFPRFDFPLGMLTYRCSALGCTGSRSEFKNAEV
jgi:hypothetical protein